ncbi:HET-domain-containing protein, partial [Viridothelium virens]
PSVKVHRFTWGDFATLSYTWGVTNDTTSITLNGVEWPVTLSLEAALRALRDLGCFQDRFRLWVDAICINQEDQDERRFQVPKMRELYDGSWTTITWLGGATEDSHKTLQLLTTLAQYESREESSLLKDKLQEEPDYLGRGKWIALQSFLQRRYWSRLWIIQELALAPLNMLMLTGDGMITWQEVQDGLTSIHVYHWFVKDACLQSDWIAVLRDQGEGDSTDSGLWDTENLHHIDKDIAHIARKESHGEGFLSFAELLYLANAAHASRPLDKVYGLLAIMDPIIAREIIPDYTIEPSELFTRVAKIFITTGNLETICEGNPWSFSGTPSCVPDWLQQSRNRDKHRPPLPYSADANSPPKIFFSDNLYHLSVDAIIVDRVEGLGACLSSDADEVQFEYSAETICYPDVFDSAYGSADATRLALLRALIGDRCGLLGDYPFLDTYRSLDLFKLPISFLTAKAEFQRRGWNEFALQGFRYLQWEHWWEVHGQFWLGKEIGNLYDMFADEIPEDAEERNALEMYRRFRNVISGRRFAPTKGGRFAWVPDNVVGDKSEQVQKDDMFAIVSGCRVPLVIRCNGDGLYQVLGDGYIQGFMEGEAL